MKIMRIATLLFLAILAAGRPLAGYCQDNVATSEAAAKGPATGNRFSNRIYVGTYGSYFSDNIRLMQLGYDFVLSFIDITPSYRLLDVGLGVDGLLAFDDHGGASGDRPINARITPGLEINWSVRLYSPPIGSVKARIFVEGQGMNLVAYSRAYPDNGTCIDIGSNASLGIEYPIANGEKSYVLMRLFHTSNGQKYEDNPALNAIGMVVGLQFM